MGEGWARGRELPSEEARARVPPMHITGLLGVKRCTSVTQLSELRGMLLSNVSESIGHTLVR